MRILSESPNECTATRACDVGALVYLFVERGTKHRVPLTLFRDWILAPLEVGQLKIFYDEYGDPCGYLAWARTSDDVHESLLEGTKQFLTFDEWNEGSHLWITDFDARKGFAMTIARWARRNLFLDFREAMYVRGQPPALRTLTR